MIYVARPRTGKNRVVVDIGIHGLVPVGHREYRPCLIDRVLHFVPDQDASGPALQLTKRGMKHADAFDALNPHGICPAPYRAAERGVEHEGVSTGCYRWSTDHSKKEQKR